MRTRWVKSLTLIDTCWLCISVSPNALTPTVESTLAQLDMHHHPDTSHCMMMKVNGNWSIPWRNLSASIKKLQLQPNCQIGVVAGDQPPALREIEFHLKTVEETDEISGCMWLIEALTDNRINCHLQPVMDRRNKVFGYESLVRATGEDGNLISGGAVFNASKVLRIEHLIDRALHELAVKTFAEKELDGSLFINFVPGFIQRPEFYLEGLADAVRTYNISPKQIVLDCTQSENPRDLKHLKSVFEYCRSRGYLIALDDIESTHSAKRITSEIRPDFIRLDMRLIRRIEDPNALETVRELVSLAKGFGISLIAEGVETETIHRMLQDVGVDLFQGYLFSPPAELSQQPSPSATKRPSSKKSS